MEKTLEIKRKAQRFVQNGDLDRAVEEYQKLLAADDTDPYTHVTLGDLYFKKGVLDEAGRRYQEAAEAYRKAGLVKNAIAVCKKMLRLNLRAMDTLKSLAELHAQDGLSTDAGIYYSQYAEVMLGRTSACPLQCLSEEAVRLIPEDPKYAEKLGELWNLEGEKLKASRALIKAARAYDGRGQLDQAQAMRDRAEELHPGASVEPVEAPPEPPPPPAGPVVRPPSSAGRISTSSGEDIARNGTFVPPATASREGIESTRIGAASTSAAQATPLPMPVAPSRPSRPMFRNTSPTPGR